MFINWGIDAGVGLIPVVGDLFDIVFKSNTKNVETPRSPISRSAPSNSAK